MPFIFPYPIKKGVSVKPRSGVKGLGAGVPAKVPVGVRSAVTASTQQPRTVNPRAPAPVPTSILEQSTQHIADISKTLSTGVISSESIALPTSADIIDCYLNTTVNFTPGATVSGSVQATTALEQIFIFDAVGAVTMVILGEQLHMLYSAYSVHKTDFPDTAVTLVASTPGSANSVIQIPYLRLPAASGPFSMQLYFVGYGSLGQWGTANAPTLTAATGITSASVVVGVDVIFGNAEGATSYLNSATLSVSQGINPLVNRVPMQNQSIANMILYGFSADDDLGYVRIVTNGQTIEGYTTYGQLIARDAAMIQATRPTGLFWLLPNSQFALNSSSTFDIFGATGISTQQITVVMYRVG